MSAHAKALRAERGKLILDARAIINSADATPEREAEADKMLADAEALMAKIDRAEKADKLAADLGEAMHVQAAERGLHVADVEGEKAREQKLFKAYITGNFAALNDAERGMIGQRINAAGSVGTTTAGGYAVAPGFMDDLLVAQAAYGGMRAASRVIRTTTGVDLAWPTMDDTSNVASIVSENTSGAAGTDITLGSKTLKAWTYRSGYLSISRELLQDSAFDFDSLIRDALARRFAAGQNAHFTTGNGTSAPQGISIGGSLGKTGASGQTLTVLTTDLIDLEHSVDPVYRPGARFMMNDSSFKVVKKLVDGQSRPLFLPGFTVGASDTILGYPVTINQDVAVMAASAKSIFFGNFQNYIIRDVMGLEVVRLNELHAANFQVSFIAFQRTDGRITSAAAPIKWYANSAS